MNADQPSAGAEAAMLSPSPDTIDMEAGGDSLSAPSQDASSCTGVDLGNKGRVRGNSPEIAVARGIPRHRLAASDTVTVTATADTAVAG